MYQLAVSVHAGDRLSQIGVGAELSIHPEVRVVESADEASVALVVADEVGDDALRMIRGACRGGGCRVVLIVTRIDERSLLAALEAGVNGIVRRSDATGLELVAALRRAENGDGTLPSDLLGSLLQQVARLQRQVLAPRGLSFSGLSEREVNVLRLVAEGLDTAEIASKMCYSERTVKNVIHDVTSRLQLRNRSQAVAYAMREGFI